MPPQAQRGLNASWNIASGVCQTLGGIAFGVATFESGVEVAAGIVVALHGGYKVSVGFEQMANVISGGEAKNDREYVTPEGSISKNKTVDNVTDLTVGFSYTKPKNFVYAVNAVSTVKTGFDVGKDILNSSNKCKFTISIL